MPRYPIAKHRLATALLALVALALTVPAHAAGETEITHAKALAGNVTPGDTPGYPVTLSIPGSFQLASNLVVAANKVGIQVTSPNVTVDLNGFLMQGSNVAWYGITGGVDNVTIRNGTIDSFKFDGIHGTGRFWSIEDLRVVSNGRDGILVGDDAHVRDSTSAENGREGVICFTACLVERNTATSNGGSGIFCRHSCHAEGNVASYNNYLGIFVRGGLALGNTIAGNVSFGISSGGDSPAVYGNNVLIGNNQGNAQAQYVTSLHANFCFPGACP